MVTKISNGKIISKNKIITGKSLYIRDDKILYAANENFPSDKIIDAKNCYVSAGFIDMHTHGGGGCDFMDGGTESVLKAVKLHLAHGTTSILPTSMACSKKALIEFLADVKQILQKKTSAANIIGVHLEGPYFSMNQRGAQNPKYIKAPERAEYEEIIEFAGKIIKRWSFAPELEGSTEFCKTLLKNNIIPAIAHSDAVYRDVKNICELGCRLVTHFYSGMSTITRHGGFRELGVIESAYLLDDISVEIIADGKHLPPELLRLIYKLKGVEKISLVTDSMRGAGMGEGSATIDKIGESMPCIIEDGVAKLPDRSAFAGSIATADKLVRTMVKDAGVSIVEAVKMITQNPAKLLGLKNKGDIEDNLDADIVIFDEEINIKNVIAAGKETGLENK